ncbi:MAG: PASTA domain-containing protein [Clostridiaceae bacterium]|nr:PASTA domain-containing protein [Clostridiaceae bacterium]
MDTIPDVLGYKLEDALIVLKEQKLHVTTRESISHKCEKQGEIRVIRQNKLHNNEIELILSYF